MKTQSFNTIDTMKTAMALIELTDESINSNEYDVPKLTALYDLLHVAKSKQVSLLTIGYYG